MQPLFLIGFMAAGKTSVGRALAKQQGRRFLDLDDAIAERAGEPVSALVARDEPGFRQHERAALAQAIADAHDGPVIATGGGAAAFADNLDRMRAAGCVIALNVDPAVASTRAAGGGSRPLLERGAEAIQALAATRAPVYRRAHAVVDTHDRSVEDVIALVAETEAVFREASGDATTVVALPGRSYPVIASTRFEASLVASRLRGVTKVALITDANVAAHWRARAEQELHALRPITIVIPPGEAAKSFATYQELCDRLIDEGLDRGSAIVALGGGVVGDLAGFVAATLFRGIPIIQMPTTIVAMTDAAIGGKTAVDTRAGKNLVGAFHQPRLVACNTETLATLPARERRAGFGELWKYALLDGPDLWALVDACAAWGSDGGPAPPELREVISRAIAYKAAVVGRDEVERKGQRAMLNLGHTVGHAIESHTGMLHGEAVGLGLVVAARVSAVLGLSSDELEGRIADALRRTGMPHDPSTYLTDEVLARVGVDKKRTGDKVKFIAIREVGACEPVEIAITDLGRILRAPLRA
jgi:shikimate kinase/3-dehydroquinate synthase